uniref:Uncharacterized protein n=1 Tax=Marseillevirus LCMAC202 TaxID=2506606 RepID=A0A481YZY6_9VIRU|nr:MAG: hypothetical protein LCMAC202_04460 [Marseillevirus LCMAC202]
MECWVVEETAAADDDGNICGVYSSIENAKKAILKLYGEEASKVLFSESKGYKDRARIHAYIAESSPDYEAFCRVIDEFSF